MKLLELITFFVIMFCIKSKNESYYSDCEFEYVYEEKTNVPICSIYNPIEIDNTSICCYYKYAIPYAKVEYITIYYKKGEQNNQKNKTEEQNKRKLEYLYNYYESCIGISQEGYNNINKVIKEIEDEKKYSFVQIDCTSKYIKLIIIILFPIILIIF